MSTITGLFSIIGAPYANGVNPAVNQLGTLQTPLGVPGAFLGVESFAPSWEAAAMLQQSQTAYVPAVADQSRALSLLNTFNEIMSTFFIIQMLKELLRILKTISSGRSADGAAAGAAGSASSAGAGGNAGTVPVTNSAGDVKDRPNGLQEIIATFGQPGTNQVTMQMPAGPGGKMISVTAHKAIIGKMKAAFEEIKARGLSGLIKSFDGAFNNRNKRGGSTKSTHAWGIAFDINAAENPMGSSRQTAGQRQLAAIFAKYGFYQLPNDPMHFQYATGY